MLTSSGGWRNDARVIQRRWSQTNRAIQQALPWRPERDDLDGLVRHALAWERSLVERGRLAA